MDKFIVTEKKILVGIKSALEKVIQEKKIVDILMNGIGEEVETILYDDCEMYEEESEE